MKFAYPLIALLAPVAMLALWGAMAAAARARRRRAEKFAGGPGRSWAATGELAWRRRAETLLTVASLGLLLLAGARPLRYRGAEKAELQGVPYLVALDASRSMLASDLRPSRWTVTTNALDRFFAASPNDRVGLISFSGAAYLNAPLSFDMTAIRTTLRYLDPWLMNDQGTALSAAIDRAGRYFATNKISPRVLVLISDGEDLEGNPVFLARRWARDGLRIACVGVGTTTGAKVPAGRFGGGPVARNTFGQEVISRLNEANLQRIAAAAGGRYYRLGEHGEGLQRLREEFLAPLSEAAAREDLQNYVEWYQVPLSMAVACLLVSVLVGAERHRRPTAPTAIKPQPTA